MQIECISTECPEKQRDASWRRKSGSSSRASDRTSKPWTVLLDRMSLSPFPWQPVHEVIDSHHRNLVYFPQQQKANRKENEMYDFLMCGPWTTSVVSLGDTYENADNWILPKHTGLCCLGHFYACKV